MSFFQMAVLLIKWSKTIQNRTDVVTISLPDLKGSHLCPVSALKAMFQIFSGSDNSPVFVIPKSKGLVPLTDSVARKHLKDVSGFLGLNPSLTFHDFRRSGAVWAYQNGVPLEHIMKHGIWKSDAIWTYLSSAVTAVSPGRPCISTGFTSLVLLGFGYLSFTLYIVYISFITILLKILIF